MNSGTIKIFKVLGLFVFVLIAAVTGAVYWLERTEESCWKHEATEAFRKYSSFKTRIEILGVVDIQNDLVSKDLGSNPLEVIEKDPNGCSFGGNGQTVLRFFFNDRNEITAIQVFRNYIASNYRMTLIDEEKH
jgi:hypothetical protein